MTDGQVRAEIYRQFRHLAVTPTVSTVATSLRLPIHAVEGAFVRLAESHAIVLDDESHDIRMAHPFAGSPTGFVASIGDRSWDANCGWDAIAILALLGDGQVRAPDPLGGEILTWSVHRGQVAPEGVVHFLVPASEFWDNIGYT